MLAFALPSEMPLLVTSLMLLARPSSMVDQASPTTIKIGLMERLSMGRPTYHYAPLIYIDSGGGIGTVAAAIDGTSRMRPDVQIAEANAADSALPIANLEISLCSKLPQEAL